VPAPLRFLVCGREGAGTSTLVARLVSANQQVPASARLAPKDDDVVPGHPHERLFATANRSFAVTDASADEPSTGSVAMAAFRAQLAVVVIDAAQGVSVEAQRYSRVVALFGVRYIVLAMNKTDLIAWNSARFDEISRNYRAVAEKLDFSSVTVIPVSALTGANITAATVEIPQYRGPTLLSYLESVEIETPSGTAEAPSDQFEARLLWLNPHPLVAGRHYTMKIHSEEVGGSVSAIKYQLDLDSGSHLAARRLCANEIGVVNLSLDRPVPFAPYETNPVLGSLALIDRETNQTAGVAMIDFALRRAANLHWQPLSVDKQARSRLKQHPPRCIWLTGLSGSGKSTIANLLEQQLNADGLHTFVLDGDNVRHGLNRDLGFTEADRVENLRRVAEVAKLMVEAGLIVIVSFISPFRAERESARSLFAQGEFVEVFVDTPFEECERRDPKGLYAKARAGQLANFTGIDSPYEPPENADMHLTTSGRSPSECAHQLYSSLRIRSARSRTRSATE
jgi:adenylyl-sulfate kinase